MAGVIELAKAFQRLDPKPARTILFIISLLLIFGGLANVLYLQLLFPTLGLEAKIIRSDF